MFKQAVLTLTFGLFVRLTGCTDVYKGGDENPFRLYPSSLPSSSLCWIGGFAHHKLLFYFVLF